MEFVHHAMWRIASASERPNAGMYMYIVDQATGAIYNRYYVHCGIKFHVLFWFLNESCQHITLTMSTIEACHHVSSIWAQSFGLSPRLRPFQRCANEFTPQYEPASGQTKYAAR
jgi:hypothetical protein